MLSFFPRGVLDEILNLIESVSEGFPSYSISTMFSFKFSMNNTWICYVSELCMYKILFKPTNNFKEKLKGLP